MITHFQKHQSSAGYTIFEVLEMVAAISLAAWLAESVSNHFEGVWHTVVYWTIAIIGTLVFFICFLFAFSYLLARRRKSSTQPDEKSKIDAA